jgi:hypothetical protein
MANAQLNVGFIANRQIRKNDDRTFWRYTVSGWPGSLSTLNSIPVGFGREVHTHPADHTGIVTKHIFKEIQNSNDINRIQTSNKKLSYLYLFI